jgi:hypothetical protein
MVLFNILLTRGLFRQKYRTWSARIPCRRCRSFAAPPLPTSGRALVNQLQTRAYLDPKLQTVRLVKLQ